MIVYMIMILKSGDVQFCTSKPEDDHVGLSRDTSKPKMTTFTTDPLAVQVTSTNSPILQMFLQVFQQTRYNFYSLPDHTRELSLEITTSTGEALALEGFGTNGKFILNAFRKSGVMEFDSKEWLKVPMGEDSVRVTASDMVLHKEKHKPKGRDELAYTGGYPTGYLQVGGLAVCRLVAYLYVGHQSSLAVCVWHFV